LKISLKASVVNQLWKNLKVIPMKLIVILIFFKFLLVDSSLLSISVGNETLSGFVGHLINEWNKIDPGVHDIQIFKSKLARDDKKFVNVFVENLMKIVSNENVVIFRDLNSNVVNDTLRSGAFKIILSNANQLVNVSN
jgi:hypothetical protein